MFTVGEERAIAEYIGTMADCRFPLHHMHVRQIAQDMVNMRNIQQKSKGSSSIGTSSTHVVGLHCVDRFLERNAGFKKKYI